LFYLFPISNQKTYVAFLSLTIIVFQISQIISLLDESLELLVLDILDLNEYKFQ
jgi:hypothetical protein